MFCKHGSRDLYATGDGECKHWLTANKTLTSHSWQTVAAIVFTAGICVSFCITFLTPTV